MLRSLRPRRDRLLRLLLSPVPTQDTPASGAIGMVGAVRELPLRGIWDQYERNQTYGKDAKLWDQYERNQTALRGQRQTLHEVA